MNDPNMPHEARLERIQGGVDLINERLKSSNELADMRHKAVEGDISELRKVTHRHGNEIQVLQAHHLVSQTERKTLTWGGVTVWKLIVLVGGSGGVVTAIIKGFGL